jgi:hypothetical protein
VCADVPKDVFSYVARNLGSDGDRMFFIELGLSNTQFEEAETKSRGCSAVNSECWTKWLRSESARNEKAIDTLKRALGVQGRQDMVEKIDEMILSASEEQPPDHSQE